ncbi:MAG: ABC transporter substrate-binding protein [Vicinamibacteraceae bacterium]
MLRPIVCTALVCLALAACRPEAGSTPGAGGDQASTVTVAVADPRSSEAGNRSIDVIAGLLSDEGLVGLGRDGRPEARLAERWEVSPDGLTWRFFLRPGLIFQDGEPVTAAAAKAAIAPAPAATESETLPGLRDVLAVEAPGPLELIVRLRKPNALLLESFNFSPIVSLGHAAGAGPFRPDSRTRGKAVLGRFKGYYRGRATVETITIAEYPSQREAWSAMMRGEVDLLHEVAPDAFEFVRESPNAHVASFLRPYVTALAFNAGHPVLGRRDVRRALNLAVDRRAVIDDAIGGRGVAATDHIPPNHWARDASAPVFDFDTAAAAAILDAAGLRRRGGPAPARLTFTCLVLAEPRFERLALLLQRQLQSVDVDMRLEALPLPEFSTRVAAGRFDAFVNELIASTGLGFTYMMWHSNPPGPFLRSGYASANPALDRLRTARTDDETRAAVHALQRTMHDDPPAVFLYWEQRSRAVSRRFTLPPGDDLDILRSVDRWQIVGRGSANGGAP